MTPAVDDLAPDPCRCGAGGVIQDPAVIPPYPRGSVRSGATLVTRFVERRLARRYGWNLEVFQGREAVFPGSRTGGFYRVVNPNGMEQGGSACPRAICSSTVNGPGMSA